LLGYADGMLRRVLAIAALVVTAPFAIGCDDGNDDTETDIGGTIGDDAGVPFDPEVPAGVDTPTDDVGGLGFDPEVPGPEGQQVPLPD
jgi:hypothetical protein